MPSFFVIVAMIAAWQILETFIGIPIYLLPSPYEIMRALVSSNTNWLLNIWITMSETLGGFLLSIAVGLPLGLLLVSSRAVYKTLYPLIVAFQVLPRVAIAPIVFLVIGFGGLPIIIIAFMTAFFPVLLDTLLGLRALDPNYEDLLRSLGATKWQIFSTARLPYAMPYIFNGLKIAMTFSLIGAIVAEFVQSDAGLGYVLLLGLQNLGTPTAFAALTLLTIMGLGLYVATLASERAAIPWYTRSKLGTR
jgi:NitT/TauT family transport system permease protein